MLDGARVEQGLVHEGAGSLDLPGQPSCTHGRRVTAQQHWHAQMPYMKERAGSTDPTRRFVLEGVVVVLCEGAH
jgi:hypothetical protein